MTSGVFIRKQTPSLAQKNVTLRFVSFFSACDGAETAAKTGTGAGLSAGLGRRAGSAGRGGAGTGTSGLALASSGKNCDFSSGGIAAGLGFLPYVTPGGGFAEPDMRDPPARFGALCAANGKGAESETLVYVGEGGGLYAYDEGGGNFVYRGPTFPSSPALLNVRASDGKRALLLCAENGVWAYDGSGGAKAAYAEPASSVACAVGERVFFARQPYTLRYCEPLSTENWSDSADGSGYVRLPETTTATGAGLRSTTFARGTDGSDGEKAGSENADGEKAGVRAGDADGTGGPDGGGGIVALESLGGELFVFCRGGIFRLGGAAGAARDFTLRAVDYGGGEIFGGSVCRCGEKIFFLARDGMRVFDGKRAEKTAFGAPLRLAVGSERRMRALSCAGKYLLSYVGGDGEGRTLVLDGETERGYFAFPVRGGADGAGTDGKSGVFALSATAIGVIGVADGRVCALAPGGDLPAGEAFLFRTAETDFGFSGRKVLRQITVYGRGRVAITLFSACRGGEKSVGESRSLDLADGVAEAAFCLRGETFSLTAELSADGYISAVEIGLTVFS